MSRSVPWRRTCPDKVSSRIDRAARARIYLLRATGPTGFLLTAEGDDRKFKVFLGDPHSCTCPIFVREKDLCIHILWVLIKKFRVPKENSVVYQLGLVEREIGEVVRGLFTNTRGNNSESRKTNGESDSREKLSKKEITEDDVCPICQEDLYGQSQPTTYCKYGCGNSVHIKCMKIWAEHQKSSGETIIKCPLCRVDFGPFETIKSDYLRSVKNKQRNDVHVGAVCARCRVSPITGKCYRCVTCSYYQLCNDCFSLDPHPQHSFHFRQKPNQRWRPAQKFEAIPSAVANDLERREITDQDYNLLLQLDGSSVRQCSVPAHVLNSFPTERLSDDNHRLIVNVNETCGVCLCSYRSSQVIRRLPCNHEFHRVCIDSWLSRDHNVCPIDGQTIYSDVARSPPTRGANRSSQNPRQRSLPTKKCSLSALNNKQRRSPHQESAIPQDFSLNGSSLQRRYTRNHEENLEVSVEASRLNSAPAQSPQVLPPSGSSSRHIIFDTDLPGRPVVCPERVMRYGRHSGDSRLRILQTETRNKNRKIGTKSISLNDITLSGQKISATELNHGRTLNRRDAGALNVTRSSADCDPTLLHATIVSSSPDSNCSHVRVDV